ncbi:uncharacterized protein EI90DRAFT_712606 [Cantharellus anzutake]|uniref:uncharacterized protein n=1 Tax=Cantharellus anzutake TaxID=1750568 RepID=UPI00190491BE|nr:uncharacterized protein EI90DRAFT_712606 [Cantharellus anzutake]KAF8332829.1 hypothetical protein EI90DRAFT_712606 [Cantharellus anzutake]
MPLGSGAISSPSSLQTLADAERISLLFPPPKEYREKVLNIPSSTRSSRLVNPFEQTFPAASSGGVQDASLVACLPSSSSVFPPTPPPKNEQRISHHRRKSTKELVSLYEAKESQSKPSGPRINPNPAQSAPDSSPELDFRGRYRNQGLGGKSAMSESRTRASFPGRESIRNFLGAFNIAKRSKEAPREFVVLRDKGILREAPIMPKV